jgi:hypothetical protein
MAVPDAAGAATAATGAASSWGRAIEVPGLGALNKGRNASVSQVSCASAGSCAVGGDYQDGRRHLQGFVASERNGHWGRAIEVPGLAALNKGRSAGVLSVSCASPGNCAAGGDYQQNSSHPYAVTSGDGFVVSERNGRWGRAIEVPGLAALNKRRYAEVSSVSCASAGNCAAGGFYRDGSGLYQGFVVSERNGRWGQAIEVPGLGALNKGGGGQQGTGVNSVSCASPGNCAADGSYFSDTAGHQQAFVVSQENGTWGTAQQVAGNLNTSGIAFADTVSCGSAGNCSAGGSYTDGSRNAQAFVVSEVNGTWTAAREVAGRLNTNGAASVFSVSCPAAGSCAAGGDFDYDYNWGFLVGEKNGAWGTSITVPGVAALAFRFTDVNSVSCAAAGSCAAGGDYETLGGSQGFVASQHNGDWGKAITVPGLGALNNKNGNAEVSSVSCPAAGGCVAGGDYQAAGGSDFQGFVTQGGRA